MPELKKWSMAWLFAGLMLVLVYAFGVFDGRGDKIIVMPSAHDADARASLSLD